MADDDALGECSGCGVGMVERLSECEEVFVGVVVRAQAFYCFYVGDCFDASSY